MRLEHYSEKRLKKELRDIVGKHLDPDSYRVFVFGSRVAGAGSERSDVDVGIEGEGPVPTEAMAAIQEEVDRLPLLYKVDIVDWSVVSPKFKAVVGKQREYLDE